MLIKEEKWINLINSTMRVRCLELTKYNDPGDVIIVQENDDTLIDIENSFIEQFNYSRSDEEIVNICEKNYCKKDFEKLYGFILGIYESDSVNNILLQDGRKIERMFQPDTPEQWLAYNSLQINYFSKKYPSNTINGLKADFFKRLDRVPDTGVFLKKELEYLKSWILDHRSNLGCDKFRSDPSYVYDSWYDMTVSGSIPTVEPELNEYLSKYLPGGANEFLRGKSLAEYEAFLNSFGQKKKKKENIQETRFEVVGIDVERLVKDLEKRKFFDPEATPKLLDWFNGKKPEKPINILLPTNYFVTIIADLCDVQPKCIQNTKFFCYSFIYESFVFNGKRAKMSYIENVMKKNGMNRITYLNKRIPNINEFRTSI